MRNTETFRGSTPAQQQQNNMQAARKHRIDIGQRKRKTVIDYHVT
jgi:hypothetical protein